MRYEDIVAVWRSRQVKTAADIACEMNGNGVASVSYTHLTLPTILHV